MRKKIFLRNIVKPKQDVAVTSASLCAQHTVRPNNTKTSEYMEQRKISCGMPRRQVAHDLKNPELPQKLSAKELL